MKVVKAGRSHGLRFLDVGGLFGVKRYFDTDDSIYWYSECGDHVWRSEACAAWTIQTKLHGESLP